MGLRILAVEEVRAQGQDDLGLGQPGLEVHGLAEAGQGGHLGGVAGGGLLGQVLQGGQGGLEVRQQGLAAWARPRRR